MAIQLTTPLDKDTLGDLRCGDDVRISGVIYTARDAAHERLVAGMEKGETPPIPLLGQVVYYAGPTPNRPGRPVGALGPTTSGRMDAFTPALIRAGLMGMIGKGKRNQSVKNAIQQYGAVYFGAMGGAGALLARCVKSREVVAFPELQSEALSKLVVVDFPCVVIIDARGNDLYEIGPQEYCETQN